MEVSLESRLPEADSLPDGFVESSTEEPRLSYFSQKSSVPVASGRNDSLLDADIRFDEPISASHSSLPEDDNNADGSRGSAKVGSASLSESVPAPRVVPDQLSSPCGEQNSGDGSISNRETMKSSGLHAASSKHNEISAYLQPESQMNPKLVNDEASEEKSKAGKRNVKSGKESSEFNFMRYQKVITERDAAIAVREKLESLCRELQRQNKMLMEECKRVSTEGQSLRLEFSKKFSDTIEDVSKKLEMQKDEALAQLKENELLRTKLVHLTEQFALSEQAFREKLEQKKLELQLADLRIQQHQERSAQEQTQKELFVEQISQLLETEKSLRLQLASDGEKFKQFQEALQKSNEVFETFNKEMKKMTKLVNDLKKENTSLKGKCEEKTYSIAALVSERENMKKELEKVKRQKENLESLCRSLQAERKKNREDLGQKSSELNKEELAQSVVPDSPLQGSG